MAILERWHMRVLSIFSGAGISLVSQFGSGRKTGRGAVQDPIAKSEAG